MTACRLFRGLTKTLLLWGLALLFGAAPAWAGEPTGVPLLRLETGMHTAKITSIATDEHGRWAVTGSDDKTARLWSVETGRPEGILRVPQDTGNEGKIYSVAISPDGAQVAVSGITGWSWDGYVYIYLFDRATRHLQRRITGLPDAVFRLAYSADGRWLAAGLGRNNGIRVFDPRSGQQVGADDNYGGSSYSVEFSPIGYLGGTRLLSTSWDGKIRLYEVTTSGQVNLLESQPSGGIRPYTARFSPDGGRVAVGFDDTRIVNVFGGRYLNLLKTLDPGESIDGGFQALAWSADGTVIAAAGGNDGGESMPVLLWAVQDWSRLGNKSVSDGMVNDLVSLPNATGGGWLFASQDPSWGVLDGQMVPRRQDGHSAVDFRNQKNNGVLLSSNGEKFIFSDSKGDAVGFDVIRRGSFNVSSIVKEDMAPARIKAPGVIFKDWVNKFTPTLNAQPIKLEKDEISRSLAVDTNGNFGLGTAWWLRFFEHNGQPRWQITIPGDVWTLNISADGRWVVAGYGDGTIRWHRIEDGREVLAFFPHADRQRWVLWTPEGFYAASPGAEGLIGYHVNQGKAHEGEFISAAQLRDHFYNPALVSARLGPDGDRLMAEAVKQLGDVETLLANARNVPPVVELLSAERVEVAEEVEITFRVQERGNGGVGALKFYVDGQPVEGRHMGVGPGVTGSRSFKLAHGVHVIEVAATSRGGVEGPRRAVNAVFTGARTPSTLHILAIGVDHYQDTALQLKHSVHDAEQIAAELAQRAHLLFDRVTEPRVLRNDQARLADIGRTFDEMEAQFGRNDTLVIFLAGHGEAPIGKFTFLPWDFKRGASGALGEGLNEARLLQMLDRSPRNTLLLIDSCDAGSMVKLVEGAYMRMGDLKKRAVIGASRRGELAREGYDGHGVFTAALLQSLGKTGSDPEDLIVPTLYGEVKAGVTRISRQMPGGYQQEVQGFLGTADFAVVRRRGRN